MIAAGFPQRPAHSGVFAHIDLEGTRLTVLAERANMTPQAMKDLVDALVRLGYVARRPDPTDGRAKLITLTERGRACIAASIDVIARLERRLEALLGPEHLAALQQALVNILRHDW